MLDSLYFYVMQKDRSDHQLRADDLAAAVITRWSSLYEISTVGKRWNNRICKERKKTGIFESLTRYYRPLLCFKVSIQLQAPLFDSGDRRDVELTQQCWERRLFWSVPLGAGYLEWALSKPSTVLFPAEDNHATAHPSKTGLHTSVATKENFVSVWIHKKVSRQPFFLIPGKNIGVDKL